MECSGFIVIIKNLFGLQNFIGQNIHSEFHLDLKKCFNCYSNRQFMDDHYIFPDNTVYQRHIGSEVH